MSRTSVVVQADGVWKQYRDRVALQDVSLQLSSGECVVITGANGAGKTTLLRCLSGMTRPSRGAVNWPQAPAYDGYAVARQLGYVAHESQLYPQLTLRENLVFAARMYAVAAPARRADRLLRECGLAAYSSVRAGHTSRGIQRRLSIARAIVHEPHVLMMDEPFTALDQPSCQWLEDLLRRSVRAGGCVCLTTHDPQAASQLGSRIVELRDGQVDDTPETPRHGQSAA